MSVETDDIELAQWLSGVSNRKEDSSSDPGTTKTIYGTATSDSEDGTVYVDLEGTTISGSGEQSVPLTATCSVKSGQKVIITLVNNDPIVTGVAGWGDEVNQKAAAAESIAKAAVKQVDVEYAVGDSQSTAPTSGWSTSTPEWTSGKYIWQRTVLHSSDEATYSDPVCIQGAKGEDGAKGDAGSAGRGVSSITPQYYLSTSSSSATGGSWKTSPPEYSSGHYYWIRNKIVWQNPTSTTYTTAVYDSSLTEALSSVAHLKTLIREDETYGVEVGKSADGTTFDGIHTTMGTEAFAIHAADHTELATFSAEKVEIGKNSKDATIDMLGGTVQLNTATVTDSEGVTFTSGFIQSSDADSVGIKADAGTTKPLQSAMAYVTSGKNGATSPGFTSHCTYNGRSGNLTDVNTAGIASSASSSNAIAYMTALNGSYGTDTIMPRVTVQSGANSSIVGAYAEDINLEGSTLSVQGASTNVSTSMDRLVKLLSNQPVVLFERTSQPSTSPNSVTVTKNLNNYKYLKIYGSTGEWRRCYCELYKPDGGNYSNMQFTLSAFNGSGSNIYIKMTDYRVNFVSDTSWTISTVAYNELAVAGTSANVNLAIGPSIMKIVGVPDYIV